MLTEAEKEACRKNCYTIALRQGYGTPGHGICPVAAVAVLRGATLYVHPETGLYGFLDLERQPDGGAGDRAQEHNLALGARAEQDVMVWAGYTSLRVFLDALEAQGAAIFPADEVSA